MKENEKKISGQSNHKFKKLIITFFSWVITNTIWTYITFIIPFGLFIPTVRNIIKSIKTQTYTISLYNIIIVILSFIIFVILEIFIIYMIRYTKQMHDCENEVSDILKDKDDTIIKNNDDEIKNEEIDYNTLEYYFEKYHKHLTVYKNGNGIIINSFTIVINDINSIMDFKREININDAKVNAQFPKFSSMKRTKLDDRFTKYGFWCKCTNNNELIASTKEYYWSNDPKEIDVTAQTDPKDLKIVVQMNPSSIEVGKPYNIVYVMSIPDMFPIENGKFSENIANIKDTYGKFSSQVLVHHKVKKFKYTVSFENGFRLAQEPIGKILNIHSSNKNLHYIKNDNIIFKKYIFSADDPEIGSTINISWRFTAINKNGGKRNGKKSNQESQLQP